MKKKEEKKRKHSFWRMKEKKERQEKGIRSKRKSIKLGKLCKNEGKCFGFSFLNNLNLLGLF